MQVGGNEPRGAADELGDGVRVHGERLRDARRQVARAAPRVQLAGEQAARVQRVDVAELEQAPLLRRHRRLRRVPLQHRRIKMMSSLLYSFIEHLLQLEEEHAREARVGVRLQRHVVARVYLQHLVSCSSEKDTISNRQMLKIATTNTEVLGGGVQVVVG